MVSIGCLVISLSLPWVTPLIVSVSKQPGGSQEMTGLIFKTMLCMITSACVNVAIKLILTLCWPNEFNFQRILSFLKLIRAWPRLILSCVSTSPHVYVPTHELFPELSSIVELKHTLPDLDHFLSSSERLHAVRPWQLHILSSSGSHDGESFTSKKRREPLPSAVVVKL